MKALERRRARARGALLVSSSAARIQRSFTEHGEITEEELLRRVGYLAALTTAVAQRALGAAWSEAELTSLFDGDWPSFASVAVERCYGRLSPPRRDILMPSRALRIAQARAGETLRSVEHSYRITESLLKGEDVPPFSDAVSVRNAHRAIRNEIKRRKHEGAKKPIPTSFFEVRPEPPALSADIIRLDPTDAQFAYWGQMTSIEALLHLKLPTRARPSEQAHWEWHELHVLLPRSVRRARARGAQLTKPTLRLKDGRLLIDLATEEIAPKLKDEGPYFALDWGERRLLTGSLVWRDKEGELHTDGRPFFFDAKGIQGKLARLRKGANRLQKKIDHIDRLLAGKADADLQSKRDAKTVELAHVWSRYSKLSGQLAHAGARWATEAARANGCQGLLTEDLRSLEARFPGNHSDVNARINHQVRGKLYNCLAHKAACAGLSFDSGYARGTSSFCPRCRRPIKHQKASNNSKRGRGWMTCSCGHSADRDHASSECVGARVLAEQDEALANGGKKPAKGRPLCADKPLRRSHRGRRLKSPRNRPRRASSSSSRHTATTQSSCQRAGRAGPERCVRLGDAPREVLQRSGPRSTAVSIKGSPVGITRTPARSLQGMHQGFTGQLAFTPVDLPQRTLVRHERRRVKASRQHPPRSQENPRNR